jgi:hypothetical protein
MLALDERHAPYLERLLQYHISPMDIGTEIVTIEAAKQDWRFVEISRFVYEKYIFINDPKEGSAKELWERVRQESDLSEWAERHSKFRKGGLNKVAKAIDHARGAYRRAGLAHDYVASLIVQVGVGFEEFRAKRFIERVDVLKQIDTVGVGLLRVADAYVADLASRASVEPVLRFPYKRT